MIFRTPDQALDGNKQIGKPLGAKSDNSGAFFFFLCCCRVGVSPLLSCLLSHPGMMSFAPMVKVDRFANSI